MIFSLLRLLVFLPLVSSKFYNLKLELVSPCDGKLQINFVKLNHIFPFYANQPLFIDNWYLYIHSILVNVDCLPDTVAMFGTRMTVNEKIIVSDTNWKCNQKTSVYNQNVYPHTFTYYELSPSSYIGSQDNHKISCILDPETYSSSNIVLDTSLVPTYSPTVLQSMTKSPTMMFYSTKNPTKLITKTKASSRQYIE